MKRRTLLAGLGAAASGSGAIATSAAVANSVQTTSQLSIVVNERLEVRAGQAFNDDGTVRSAYTNRYVPYNEHSSFFNESSGGLKDINPSEIPVATVNRRDENIDDEVKLQTAISIENELNTPLFKDILEIKNYGGEAVNVGISYDRDDDQYGSDVNVGGDTQNEITQQTVQHIFRFLAEGEGTFGSGRISPDQSDDSDEPANYAGINPGGTISIDLQVNLTDMFSFIDVKQHISEAADTTPTFQGTLDAVDLLDAITVVRENS